MSVFVVEEVECPFCSRVVAWVDDSLFVATPMPTGWALATHRCEEEA